MSYFDLINGCFEFFASFFILNHCRVLDEQKSVKGVSIVSTVFFALWGGWNLVYYPALNQWFSFVGGIFIMVANILWISMMIHYKRME